MYALDAARLRRRGGSSSLAATSEPPATTTTTTTTTANKEEEEDAPTELLPPLPNDLVLGEIVAKFLDEDAINSWLPQVSRLWRKLIRVEYHASLWRWLCVERAWKQWTAFGLMSPAALRALRPAASDFRRAYHTRKRVRTGGPYTYVHVYWRPTHRSMWTPKDLPPVQVTYHYRILWFTDDDSRRVLYASVPHADPDALFAQMRAIRMAGPGVAPPVFAHVGNLTGAVDHHPPSKPSRTATTTATTLPRPAAPVKEKDKDKDSPFWWGTFDIRRAPPSSDSAGEIECAVEVPMRRHLVRFRFFLEPGGSVLRWDSLQSARFDAPTSDVMHHPLPGVPDSPDREFWYREGGL